MNEKRWSFAYHAKVALALRQLSVIPLSFSGHLVVPIYVVLFSAREILGERLCSRITSK
jgi:hypothetical protein